MIKDDFLKGIWRENPVLVQLLGMCPTLATTTSSINGLFMGMATTFVVTASGLVISSLRKIIPSEVRIPTFTVIIATFVTVAKLFLDAQFPQISKALGPYVPLIVVNCLILGRQEAFTSKNPVHRSFADTLGMGVGFTLVLVILGSIRELMASGTIFDISILGDWYRPMVIMVLPAGAFITLGLLVGFFNIISDRRKESQ